MNTKKQLHYELALRAWEQVKNALQDSTEVCDRWHIQYVTEINEIEKYVLGSLDRFCLIYDSIHRRLQGHGVVLDAGAGYGIQVTMFQESGYEVVACDLYSNLPVYQKLGIPYYRWHLEAEPAPFPPEYFDAVILSQTIEHFTYSPKHALEELLRILKPRGWLLIDAPNISSLRNIWRLLRGRTIHWSLRKHYLEQKPEVVNGVPYFDRHNREYAREDFEDIAEFFGLRIEECRYYSPIHPHKPWWARVLANIRDIVPCWRKGIYALYQKR